MIDGAFPVLQTQVSKILLHLLSSQRLSPSSPLATPCQDSLCHRTLDASCIGIPFGEVSSTQMSPILLKMSLMILRLPRSPVLGPPESKCSLHF